jgi:DnaJ-class molecular chaperone
MEPEKAYEQMSPGDEAPPGTQGTGEDICDQCSGTGKVDGNLCETCGGTGRVVRGVGGA